jgi:hypothetical protein
VAEDLWPTDPESVGSYRLLRRLGTGGMGQVYLARSPGGRLVAVKVIRPDLAAEPGFRARFAREVSAARTVSGIFTAPVLDADPEGPQPWLATAYVPGPSLAAAVAEHGPLPAGVVLTLGAGLAEGLQAIHAAGLVHRDLKPSNVLLADDGPRVIDFGISRATDASMLTQAGTIMGSPGFLSPEQAEGREVGPPSDVFSLGAVLAFAAGGEGPFGTGTAASLVYRVVNAAPNLSAVPDQLRPVIDRCLAKDPASRPTAGELLASFGAAQRAPQWLPPAPPAAPPAGPGTPPWASAETGYHARTQTHLTPTPPWTPAGVTPPARPAGGTTPAWAPGGPAAPAGPMGPAGPAGPMGPMGTVPGPTSSRGNRGRAALIAGAALVLAAASAGIALAVTSHSGAASAAPATHQSVPSATASPALATTSPAPASTSPVAAKSPAAKAAPSVVGVWTGTYTCNQGLSGVRLTITGAGGDTVRAIAEFYAVPSNPGVPDGSYVLTGNYSASGGLVLIPDYWINEPAGYEMVGLSGPAPNGNSMHGKVQGVNCTTFSVTR